MSLSFTVLDNEAAKRIAKVSEIVSSANDDDIVNGMIVKSENDKLNGDISYEFK